MTDVLDTQDCTYPAPAATQRYTLFVHPAGDLVTVPALPMAARETVKPFFERGRHRRSEYGPVWAYVFTAVGLGLMVAAFLAGLMLRSVLS